MSYLVANFAFTAGPATTIRAVPFESIRSLEPVDDDQTVVYFKNDTSGNNANDYCVYVQGNFKDLCNEFANARRADSNLDASAITQASEFEKGAKKLGKLESFS